MLVVHLVSAPDRSEVGIVRITEPLRALMDEDVVNKEVGHAVKGDAQGDPDPYICDATANAIEEQGDRR